MIERRAEMRTRYPRWVPWGILGVVALSIPWYWPSGSTRPFVMGMPLWAFASLVACLVFAGLVAFVILRHWPDADADADSDARAREPDA